MLGLACRAAVRQLGEDGTPVSELLKEAEETEKEAEEIVVNNTNVIEAYTM